MIDKNDVPGTDDGFIKEAVEEMEDNLEDHIFHISTHIDCDWDLWLEKQFKQLFGKD
jgi:hypothetical protein